MVAEGLWRLAARSLSLRYLRQKAVRNAKGLRLRDGQGAARAPAASAAGGAELRRGRPADRRSTEPEVPGRAVGGLWGRLCA